MRLMHVLFVDSNWLFAISCGCQWAPRAPARGNDSDDVSTCDSIYH